MTSSHTHDEQLLDVNGIALCTQGFGDPSAPVLLLIGGADAAMDWWDDEFCGRLAAGGRHVIRYDTRDTGGSTTFPPGNPTYGRDAVLDDGVTVKDRLDEITAPTLVLHGTADPLLPYGHGEALSMEIPGARLVPLERMGHGLPPTTVWDTAIAEILAISAEARA
jgi:pimeloyl-ACP methyl ester carboxylesterase